MNEIPLARVAGDELHSFELCRVKMNLACKAPGYNATVVLPA